MRLGDNGMDARVCLEESDREVLRLFLTELEREAPQSAALQAQGGELAPRKPRLLLEVERDSGHH